MAQNDGRRRWTDLTIERVRPAAERLELPDQLVPGLRLIVHPTGRKSWAIRARVGTGFVKASLGSWPTMTVAEARIAAGAALAVAKSGVSPLVARQEAEAAERAKQTAAKAAELALREHTFGALAKRWLAEDQGANRSAGEVARAIRKDALPAWSDRPVASIGRADVIALLDGVAARAPITANRLRTRLSRFFAWTIEKAILDLNPVERTSPPAKESLRDRVLAPEEVALLWRATGGSGEHDRIVRLLLLTGQRKQEVADLRWSELDLDGQSWTLPAARAKNSRIHVVPLSAPVLAILRAVPHRTIGEGDRSRPRPGLFGERDTEPFSGWSKSKERLDGRMTRLRAEARLGRALAKAEAPDAELDAVAPWTLHDLRRTASTGMAGLGILPHVIEAVLNHASGFRASVAGRYNHHSYLEEKRDALDRWAAHVLGIVAAAPSPAAPAPSVPVVGNVVQLRPRQRA